MQALSSWVRVVFNGRLLVIRKLIGETLCAAIVHNWSGEILDRAVNARVASMRIGDNNGNR